LERVFFSGGIGITEIQFNSYMKDNWTDADIRLFKKKNCLYNPFLDLMRLNFYTLNEATSCIYEACIADDNFYNANNMIFDFTENFVRVKILYYGGMHFKPSTPDTFVFKGNYIDFLEILSYSIICIWDIPSYYGEYINYLEKKSLQIS